jgi:hypothetical protein
MKNERERCAGIRKCGLVSTAFVLVIATSGVEVMLAQNTAVRAKGSEMTTQIKFYCNIKALNPSEKARHKQLTDKLVAQRSQIVETEKGYEFKYDPSNVTLAELAEWESAESKCCPFFDFHIDVEPEGKLLCLRLTGEEGIKPFIRAEFQVPSK